MAKLSNDELIAAFKEMTLIELSDFVKLFEETFDVEGRCPAAVAVATLAADAPPPKRRTSSRSSSSPPAYKKIAVAGRRQEPGRPGLPRSQGPG